MLTISIEISIAQSFKGNSLQIQVAQSVDQGKYETVLLCFVVYIRLMIGRVIVFTVRSFASQSWSPKEPA